MADYASLIRPTVSTLALSSPPAMDTIMAGMLEFRRRTDVSSREKARHALCSLRPAAARLHDRAGPGAIGLPIAAGAADRSLRARRRHRHQRAHPGRAAVAGHGSAIR